MKLTLIPFLVVIVLFSCKKESRPAENPPSADSAFYISSFTRAGIEIYDEATNEIDSSADFYTYSPGKIVHKSYYTYAGSTDSAQYSYYYDAANNLVKYENDFTYPRNIIDVESINFVYAAGKVTEADIVYFGGVTAKQQFSYSAGGREITVYDTLLNFGDPRMVYYYKYWLNTNNEVDSVLQVSNADMPLPGHASDSVMTKFYYDANRDITSVVDDDDTTFYTSRETRGGEVAATLKKILANLSFHVFMMENSNDALIFNNDRGYLFTQNLLHPALTARRSNSGGFTDEGVFTNNFNAGNLLIKQVLPDGYGSKTHGPSIFNYAYIKTLK